MGASLARSLGQSDDFGCGGWQRPGKSCFSQISAPEGRRTVQPPGGTTEGGDRASAPRHAVYAGDDQEAVPHHVRIKMDSCVPQWRPSGLAGANPAVGAGGRLAATPVPQGSRRQAPRPRPGPGREGFQECTAGIGPTSLLPSGPCPSSYGPDCHCQLPPPKSSQASTVGQLGGRIGLMVDQLC
jgi:hypothetical protein